MAEATSSASALARPRKYSRPISGAEKVAVLLLALERQLAGELLHKFDPEDIAIIRAASESLSPITAGDLHNLVEEFAERFSHNVDLRGRTGDMQDMFNTALASDQSDAAEQISEPVVDVWQGLVDMEQDKLVEMLETEHPQIIAIILSRSGPGFAAILLGCLPEELRNQLVRRLVGLSLPPAAVMGALEKAIGGTLLGDDGSAAANAARARLANIINLMDNEEKAAVIESLINERPFDAEDVKRRLFSFEDIETMPDKSRLMLFDQVQSDAVVTALVGTGEVLRELILSSLSARTRRMVEAELAQSSADEKAVTSARRTIAAKALELAESEDFELRLPDAEAA